MLNRIVLGIGAIIGILWRCLGWIGNGETMINLPESIVSVQRFIIFHQELGWQIAPWALIIFCCFFFAKSFYPIKLKPNKNISPIVDESNSLTKPLAQERIPLSSVYLMAASYGVEFPNKLGKFTKALRQYAIDEKVTLWGRQYKSSNAQAVTEPLIKISAEHWQKANLVWHTGSALGLNEPMNAEFHTNYLNDIGSRVTGYIDLHIDKTQAEEWLKSLNPELLTSLQ